MILIDCHTHTRFSVDSEADIHDMTKRAEELGLAAYAVTDHCECNGWYPEDHYSDKTYNDHFDYRSDFYSSAAAVTDLKDKLSGRLNLICGVELGQPLWDIDAAETVAADKRLDFIIASVHQIRNEQDFYYINYDNMPMDTIYELLGRYFSEVYDVCKWGKFDVLGHLTYCIRYMKMRNGISPDLSRYDEIIAESFRELISRGKGIEINTSGIRQGVGHTFPSMKYVKMFRDLGGEILTLGSDAHKPQDIGCNITDGIELARAAGFRQLCWFKDRKPVFFDI